VTRTKDHGDGGSPLTRMCPITDEIPHVGRHKSRRLAWAGFPLAPLLQYIRRGLQRGLSCGGWGPTNGAFATEVCNGAAAALESYSQGVTPAYPGYRSLQRTTSRPCGSNFPSPKVPVNALFGTRVLNEALGDQKRPLQRRDACLRRPSRLPERDCAWL